MKKTFIVASIMLGAIVAGFLVAANVWPDWTETAIQSLRNVGHQSVKVVYMPEPNYPIEAGIAGIQGVVIVDVRIGTDGRVLYAGAGGGSSWLLREAAEQNARRWIYQVPPHATFPLEHQVKYTFTIDKNLAPNFTRMVVTDLPDAVEVISGPMYGDESPFIPPKPRNAPAKSRGK